MSDLSVAVLGSGANGSSIGADLIAAGVDVTLIEQWPAHVEAMRREGLRIRMPDSDLHVTPKVLHLCDVAELRRSFDVVLLVVKAYDARWSASLIAPYLADGGVIAAVQNGMTTDAVAEVVGAERTVGTVIEISSTMTEPGVVHRHAPPERSWFAVDARQGPADTVARLLAHSGDVARFPDIASAKWMKLVSNASVLVPTAALGVPMLDAISVPGMREFMEEAGREALRVGVAHGRSILPIFGLTPEAVRSSPDLVSEMLTVLYDRFVVPGATTTVLQDWTKGRHSEVDDINGLVVTGGAATGVDTPVNRAIVEVAHLIERGELQPEPAILDRLRAASRL